MTLHLNHWYRFQSVDGAGVRRCVTLQVTAIDRTPQQGAPLGLVSLSSRCNGLGSRVTTRHPIGGEFASSALRL